MTDRVDPSEEARQAAHRDAADGNSMVATGASTPMGGAPEVAAEASGTTPTVDGRSTRWEKHRRQKRREIVEATLRAVRRHGAGVGMDEIAAQAGTSKTVIYRHFGDRTGLWAAVVESVRDYILSNLDVPLTLRPGNPESLAIDLTDAYLSVVERDPEIYRFVVNAPADNPVGDPIGTITHRIGVIVSRTLHQQLLALGHDEHMAALSDTWGHGLVGFIWAVANNWLATGMTRPRADVVADVSALMTPALRPIIANAPASAAANVSDVHPAAPPASNPGATGVQSQAHRPPTTPTARPGLVRQQRSQG